MCRALIDDFEWCEATQLYSTLTCGTVPWPPLGMGHLIQYKMWGAADPDVITVNGASGSMLLAQGGLAITYGVGMAEAAATGSIPYPEALGGISVRITDSSGATLLAPLKYVSDNQINFLVAGRISCVDPSSETRIGIVLHPETSHFDISSTEVLPSRFR